MSNQPWWQACTCYQIYLPSFCDGNGDGLGDFPGLLSKVDYLHELGVGAIWITPFYPSPLVDNGYDISDYCAVDARFGTLEDFREVVERCHACGIRVIIDLVVNHVSSAHPWFRDAWNNPASRYRDYFLFSRQPNNWQSFFSGSAWSAEPDTGEYYYHKFAPEQVDLNWANPEVEQEIYRVVDFWKAQGVDGFRFDVINFLTTNGIGPDNPQENGEQRHEFDINQPGIIATLNRLCRYVRQQGEAFLIGEIGSEELDILARYQSPDLMDVVFNFNIGSQKRFDIARLSQAINATQARQSGLPTLFFSSHDMPRMISRFGESPRDTERALAVLALQLTVRGVPFIYQGEELGMPSYCPQTVAQIFDIQGKTHYQTALRQGADESEALALAIAHSRDASRAPLLWTDAANAGFSPVSPWMPVCADYRQLNAQYQQSTPGSLWRQYQTLIALRSSTSALREGDGSSLSLTNECVWFIRETVTERVWIAINFGSPVLNPWRDISADVLYGEDAQWLGKNQILMKRSVHEQTPQ
ncbi:alpha-glucosidase [Kluyvera sp. CRP]|uniref:alpha-glucosidase n=1 Tax=Kluyvera sp. CRP TaxID=2873269 RepID=UPI001CC1EB41|nr:alpha-glucosidase [Kluyvera sp. CRP]UAK21888.1 alpha-glucosidase [Kluyvera sp. CRP]